MTIGKKSGLWHHGFVSDVREATMTGTVASVPVLSPSEEHEVEQSQAEANAVDGMDRRLRDVAWMLECIVGRVHDILTHARPWGVRAIVGGFVVMATLVGGWLILRKVLGPLLA